MQLDTAAIRQLRDRLLALGSADAPGPAPAAAAPTPDQQAALERIGPLAEVLFLTMEADDDRARSECEAIRDAIRVLTDDLVPDPAIDALLARLEAQLAEQGREARLEALASRFVLAKPDAEMAFTLAAAIALSDGRVAPAEQAFVEEMRRYFGISAARATALLDGAPTAR